MRKLFAELKNGLYALHDGLTRKICMTKNRQNIGSLRLMKLKKKAWYVIADDVIVYAGKKKDAAREFERLSAQYGFIEK